jgi:hypothetical protein
MMRVTAKALAAAATLVPILYYNIASIQEAFGGGPPYYDRTTNMDKWSNPVPVLAAVDAVVLGVLWFVLSRRWRSSKP